MTNSSVQALLGNNVVELTFIRRHESLGWRNVRALLGTTNYPLLNGPFGASVLHFRPPNGRGMGYDYKSKNLCVVWDFFRQEYRVFGAEQVSIRQVFDLSKKESEDEFYEWFYKYIATMSEDQKLNFMGYEGESFASMQLARRESQKAQATVAAAPKPTISSRVSDVYKTFKNKLSNFMRRKKP